MTVPRPADGPSHMYAMPPVRDGKELVDATTPWEELVRDHAPAVYRLAYRLTRDPHDAEDLTQEVFIRVFRYVSSYIPGNFDGWLYRITVNLFRDMIRRNGRLRMEQLEEGFVDRYPSGPRDVEELLLDGVVDDDVRDALAALSVDNRNAVLLYDVDGLTYGEIAAILGVRRGTVGSRICRGHAQLRAALAHRATTAEHAAVSEASVEPAA
jgi:RNA polymerase sigma factor (sigma-70 family)